MTLLDAQRQRRFAPMDRTEILSDHLETQFKPHPVLTAASDEMRENHQCVQKTATEFLSRPHEPFGGEAFISPAEVRKAALRLPRRKVPGCDGTPTDALSSISHVILLIKSILVQFK
ncbi:hypothetical protein K1T71_007207 [Dendrolimus kikuchii]|uniref:Uncharacterized protein n=1 Tax=Dendrolimus kikuchii TaxID=765133 RepID=A0ACC1CZY3_9NEOP|nr:hypothetical protein K1T71_007207 [Dendrolimus kikuchii]